MKLPTINFHHGFSTLLIISIVYALGAAGLILAPMIVGAVVDGYGFSEQAAASVASAEGIGFVIASLLATLWVRRISWSSALFYGFLLNALVNLGSTQMSELTPLLIARLTAGLTGGSLFAAAVVALGDNREPDRAFGVAQVMQSTLMFAAFISAPYLVQEFGVNGLFYMLAGVSLAMMPTLFRFPSQGELRVEHGDSVEPPASHAFLIWLGLIASFIFFFNIFGFWAFSERIGQSAGIPATDIGVALGVAQIAAIGGGILAAVLSDRFGRALPLLAVVVGQSLVLWSVIGSFTTTTFFVCVGVFQGLFVLGVSYQMGVIAEMDIKGRFLVLMTAAQGLGAAIGPGVASSLIGEGNDYSGVIAMSIGCCVISTVIFMFIVIRARD
ncbi:MAG: putative MFS family arabinose efflux permease [Halioglobus sp.]|jgi:predicted MFS family arabinose efflux permease